MKKISLSLIHIIVAITTMMICVSKLKSQSYPKAGQHVEMVPYRLSPTYDGACYLEIEIVEPYNFNNMVQFKNYPLHQYLFNFF